MKVLVLGSGAGGGLPQWNCGCEACVAARTGSDAVTPRTQSSIAVSADGDRWVLFNASPDVRTQLAAHPELHPRRLRDDPVAAVALTNADIDHCLGLMVLREGGAPPIYGTTRTERALRDGLRILPTLSAYGEVRFSRVELDREVEFRDRHGAGLALFGRPFAVESKAPPYMLPLLSEEEAADHLAGDTVGWVIRAEGAGTLVYVPGVRALDERLRAELTGAAMVLIDGTFARDDELRALGASAKTAREMGHAPLTGAGGLLAFLGSIGGPRKVLIHINNSNPILWNDGVLRGEAARAGVEVSADGDRYAL